MTVTENQPTEIAIKQLNLSYHAQQDRLLFRVGLSDKKELMVWLTQRIAKQLWKLLSGDSALPVFSDPGLSTPNEAVKQFKQEAQTFEKLQQMDFSTEYQHQHKPDADQILLAVSLSLQSQSPKCLELVCLSGVTVSMKLTEELTMALTNMLTLAAKEADWQLTQTRANSEIAKLANAVLH